MQKSLMSSRNIRQTIKALWMSAILLLWALEERIPEKEPFVALRSRCTLDQRSK
jgi:hypothetical protein